MANIKKITSFTAHTTSEGQRLSYTYSEIDDAGNLVKSNVRESMIVLDPTVQNNIDAIISFLNTRVSTS